VVFKETGENAVDAGTFAMKNNGLSRFGGILPFSWLLKLLLLPFLPLLSLIEEVLDCPP
jgi:hypothetical protein